MHKPIEDLRDPRHHLELVRKAPQSVGLRRKLQALPVCDHDLPVRPIADRRTPDIDKEASDVEIRDKRNPPDAPGHAFSRRKRIPGLAITR
jgi:hypothetical protein